MRDFSITDAAIFAKVELALRYQVGPIDTAYQLVDDQVVIED